MSHPQQPLDPRQLRQSLLRLADFIQGLERDGSLLEAAPRLLKLMGDLRSQLFEYEVRHTGRLLPKAISAEPEGASGLERESRRVVEDSLDRQREAEEEWRRSWRPGDEA